MKKILLATLLICSKTSYGMELEKLWPDSNEEQQSLLSQEERRPWQQPKHYGDAAISKSLQKELACLPERDKTLQGLQRRLAQKCRVLQQLQRNTKKEIAALQKQQEIRAIPPYALSVVYWAIQVGSAAKTAQFLIRHNPTATSAAIEPLVVAGVFAMLHLGIPFAFMGAWKYG